MSVFAVTQPTEVRVDIQVGRVDLVATDRDDIVVTVLPSNPARPGDRSAAEGVRVDRAGTAVRVIGPVRLNLFGPGDSVDVLVEVPVATTATVDVKYGSVYTSGTLAAGRVNVPYGDVTVESATRLDLAVGHGEVRVTRVAGDAEVRLKSGSARVGRIDGVLRLDGSHASVSVDSVGSSAEVTTSSGAVESAGRTAACAYGPRTGRCGSRSWAAARRGSRARTAASRSASAVAHRSGWTR